LKFCIQVFELDLHLMKHESKNHFKSWHAKLPRKRRLSKWRLLSEPHKQRNSLFEVGKFLVKALQASQSFERHVYTGGNLKLKHQFSKKNNPQKSIHMKPYTCLRIIIVGLYPSTIKLRHIISLPFVI
jgi:hypothetical protein